MGMLAGKVAIITGGAGGIGRGIALAYVKEGASVVIVDFCNAERGQEVVEGLKAYSPKVLFIQKDISQPNCAQEIRNETIDKFGKIDILINNAHGSRNASFMETDRAMFDLSFDTGFYATVNLMQACYRDLVAVKGAVINFASGAAITGQVDQSSYIAAKEAIRGLSRAVANEWSKDGIRVNLISPIAHTEGVEEWKECAPDQYQQMLKRIPLGRLGDPEKDIGQVAVFLGSEMSSYMTGQTIMVDGGAIKLY